jgi:hypothetical protein
MAKTKSKSKGKPAAKPKAKRETAAQKKARETQEKRLAALAKARASKAAKKPGSASRDASIAQTLDNAVQEATEMAMELAADAPSQAAAMAIMASAPAIAEAAVAGAKKRGRPSLLTAEEKASLPPEVQRQLYAERSAAAKAARAARMQGGQAAASAAVEAVQTRRRGRPTNAERAMRTAEQLASIPGFRFDSSAAFTGFEAGASGNRRTMTRYKGGKSFKNAKSAIQYCVDDFEGGCLSEPEIRNEMAYTMAEGSLTSDPKMMALRAGEVLWLERSRKHAETRRGRSQPLRSMPITRTVEGSKTIEEVDALMKSILVGNRRG